MLKNVYIKNIKGLRGEHTFNFEAKGLKQTQIDKENGIGLVGDTKIMKAPILIARNAAGKSTVLEAIGMGMKYKDLDDYLKELASEILYEEAGSLLNFTEGLRSDLSSLFFVRKGALTEVKKDDASKDLALRFMNKIVKAIETASRRLESTFDFGGFDELDEEALSEFGSAANKELLEVIVGTVPFNPKTSEFFNFEDDFEITLINTRNVKRSINNKNLEEADITSKLIKLIHNEINESILFPIWDCIHVISEVIEESTGVFESCGSIDQSAGFNSFSQAKTVAKRYKDSPEISQHLFDSAAITTRAGKVSLKSSMKFLDKELGQAFLENTLKALDKNISHIEESGKSIIIVNKQGRNISSDSLSFGTKKIIELISFAIINKSEGFIMIDEIENGLNISLINLLYRLLDELNLQVISTTHNPSIIYQGIVSPVNAFVNDGKSFVSAKDILETKRPANLISLFRPENYKDDFHIVNNAIPNFTTNSISSFELDKILDIVEEKFGINA